MKFTPDQEWDIPGCKNWEKITPITKGWSHDEKFHIQQLDGPPCLLRLSAKEDLEQEADLYAALKQLSGQGLALPDLLASGTSRQRQQTYRLFSWVEGIELGTALPSLSKEKQYELGKQAGQLLQKIHQIQAPAGRTPWSTYFQQKIDKKLNLFKTCGIDFEGSDKLLHFIARHRTKVVGRPQCFHHGDYHIGNMLLTPAQQLAVIDFNRLDFGDPWDEFNRITWTADKSPHFATGQIDGYFDQAPPAQFFTLMALYIAVNQIGAIPWAVDYGEEEVQTLLQQTKVVMNWFEDFSNTIPNWYLDKRTP